MKLSGDDIDEHLCCFTELIDRRHRAGIPVPRWMLVQAGRLRLASAISDSGNKSDCDEQPLKASKMLTAREVSDMLSLTSRQVRNLHADLDGEKVGGRWIFDEVTVLKYHQERDDARHDERGQRCASAVPAHV